MPNLASFTLSKILPRISLLAIFLIVLPHSLALRSGCRTASIQGSVSDPTGAIMPGAAIVLTNTATQVKRTASTDSGGVFTFPNIPIGDYTVTVSFKGFQTYSRTNIVLEVGSSIAVNVQMTVGASDQKIEVKSEGLALQTEDPTFKQTIDHQAMTEMPLNGRRMTDLITLSGGSTAAPAGDFTGSKYSYATISISVAGRHGEHHHVGGSTAATTTTTWPTATCLFLSRRSPPSSASKPRASARRTACTPAAWSTSSPAPERTATTARPSSHPQQLPGRYELFSTSPDTLHQNQFGGTFGGPIRRDKLFAFARISAHRDQAVSASHKATVPTADNLNGDWSHLRWPSLQLR